MPEGGDDGTGIHPRPAMDQPVDPVVSRLMGSWSYPHVHLNFFPVYTILYSKSLKVLAYSYLNRVWPLWGQDSLNVNFLHRDLI